MTLTVVVKLTPSACARREGIAIDRGRALARLAERQHGVVARRQLIELGLGRGAIDWRLRTRRMRVLHRGVYAVGHVPLSQRGHWLAAVLAGGEEAVLSHTAAAALWGLMRPRDPIDISSPRGRSRERAIRLHRSHVRVDEATIRDRIPTTNVARTLFDLAQVVDRTRVRSAWEEADRLGLLRLRSVEALCGRHRSRNGVRTVRALLAEAAAPRATRSPLEDDVLALCAKHGLPMPMTNVLVLGKEVDAYWPAARLTVEADSFEFHGHRAAFERDRARDAAMQVAGFRVIRLTHRRLVAEGDTVAGQLRGLLGIDD